MNHLGDTNKMVSDTPSICPFCGSYVATLDDGKSCGDSEGNWVAFRCLTSWHRGYHDPRKLQSKTCETVERHKLYDRIKRLEEFVEQLTNPKFTCDDLPKEALLQRIKRLEEALEGTVKWIVHLADSGDAGFWDVEKQSEIIAARAALKKESKP